MKKIGLIISLCISIYLLSFHRGYSQDSQPYVVMVSLDGFRWDYPEKVNTPNLDMIANNGVKAESIIPSYPSKTFPNHYSMATGLYPNNHGIVMNNFYAHDLNKKYKIGNRKAVENPDFYLGEPIWVTAKKNDIKSASYFWVGSEAPVKGISPTYWKKYDHNFPFEARIDTVIKWLSLPEKQRPNLVLLYMHEPDGVGHDYGPNTPETNIMIEYLDSLVGDLYNKLQSLDIAREINLIVTSDHGMGAISSEKTVHLREKMNWDRVKFVNGANPVFMLDVHDSYIDSAIAALDTVKHIKAWKKEDIPDHLHYGTSERIEEIVVEADQYWSLAVRNSGKSYTGGTHGYDPRNKDMHAIFYAIGPAFKEKYVSKSFENVNLYPIICNLLQIEGEKVDGKLENVVDIFR